MPPPEIPVLDVGPYNTGGETERRRVARRAADACETVGFLIIANHGLSGDLLERAFAVSRAFFALPVDEKNASLPDDPMTPRGYAAFRSKSLGRTLGLETPPDLREQFFMGPLQADLERYNAYPGAGRFYAENIWPARPREYREVFSALYGEMEALAARLMGLFALALDLPEDYFADKIDHHFSTLTSNNYPKPPADVSPGQLRAGAHTDFGSLTILAINDASGGLQVDVPGRGWCDVSPPRGTLVVNLGDMMARWTGDRWRSTLHRVVNPPSGIEGDARRQTIAYFLHPNYDARVACLPGCRRPGEAPKYPPILAGEHMREKLERRVVA